MTRDQLVELIDNTRFQTSALSRGYDEQGVDDALGAVANAIRTGDSREQLTSLVGSLRFQPTTLRRGYEQEAVDRLLEHTSSPRSLPSTYATASPHLSPPPRLTLVRAPPSTPVGRHCRRRNSLLRSTRTRLKVCSAGCSGELDRSEHEAGADS